jgi:hypothetical protein
MPSADEARRMRFIHSPRRVGAKRVVISFLILPKTIGDETRWLESAMWTEEYQLHDVCYDDYTRPWEGWVAVEWGGGKFVV